MIALWLTSLIVLVLAALACFKQASWSRLEGNFWRMIDIFDRAGMAPADARALLAWTQAHRPGFWGKLLPWRAPHVRRRRASGIP